MGVHDNKVDPAQAKSKAKAERFGKDALERFNTAKSAADYINQETALPQQGLKAHHKDNFNPDTTEHKNAGGWAGKARDDRWLIIHHHAEGQAPSSTPK